MQLQRSLFSIHAVHRLLHLVLQSWATILSTSICALILWCFLSIPFLVTFRAFMVGPIHKQLFSCVASRSCRAIRFHSQSVWIVPRPGSLQFFISEIISCLPLPWNRIQFCWSLCSGLRSTSQWALLLFDVSLSEMLLLFSIW